MQLKLLTILQFLREHQRHKIVAASSKFRTINAFILQEVDRRPAQCDLLYFEESRQFKKEKTLTAVDGIEREVGRSFNPLRWNQPRINAELRNPDRLIRLPWIDHSLADFLIACRTRDERHPDVVKGPLCFLGELADRDLLLGHRVIESVESPQLGPHQPDVKVMVLWVLAGKTAQQPHAIHRRQSRYGLCILGDEVRLFVTDRTQIRLQVLDRVAVIETQIACRELFVQDAQPCEQSQRRSLRVVGRPKKELSLSDEISACNSSIECLGEPDDAVVEVDMQIFAIERGVSDLINLIWIESNRPDLSIEVLDGL